MFEKHKQPSLEMGLAILLAVILVFSFGFVTDDVNLEGLSGVIKKSKW